VSVSKNKDSDIKLIECPRDAMQGWKSFIATDDKIRYVNSLLKVGFDTLDCGSFVSAKAIPQMADTKELLAGLEMQDSQSKLLVIVANARGAAEASIYEHVTYLGFPFSVSATFQKRNTNSTLAESFIRVQEIQEICVKANKQLVIYISMGFGNPYNDPYSDEIVFEWVSKISSLDVRVIALADTVGLATPQQVSSITGHLINKMTEHEIGVHLHSTSANWEEKLEAALQAGCKRFDGALNGIGGCPMANDELVGNMNTELMISYFEKHHMLKNINHEALAQSLKIASEIFV
jgi:hydroxymethylglutaryl-CoA lyase